MTNISRLYSFLFWTSAREPLIRSHNTIPPGRMYRLYSSKLVAFCCTSGEEWYGIDVEYFDADLRLATREWTTFFALYILLRD